MQYIIQADDMKALLNHSRLPGIYDEDLLDALLDDLRPDRKLQQTDSAPTEEERQRRIRIAYIQKHQVDLR